MKMSPWSSLLPGLIQSGLHAVVPDMFSANLPVGHVQQNMPFGDFGANQPRQQYQNQDIAPLVDVNLSPRKLIGG
jgi:hypothetical protein